MSSRRCHQSLYWLENRVKDMVSYSGSGSESLIRVKLPVDSEVHPTSRVFDGRIAEATECAGTQRPCMALCIRRDPVQLVRNKGKGKVVSKVKSLKCSEKGRAECRMSRRISGKTWRKVHASAVTRGSAQGHPIGVSLG